MNLANIQLDKQKKILIVIFCVLIAYVDINYIFKAQLSGLKSLDPKISRLENDLKKLNLDLENMRSFKGKQDIAAQKPKSMQVKIISEGQISGLLQDIASQANDSNIRIIQMRPSRQAQAEKSTVPSDKLVPFLINLELSGDYHSLGRFINKLENFPVFMEINEFKISNQLPDYLKQKVTLSIKTYVFK